MAIFPSDDPSIPAAQRLRLHPQFGYRSDFIEYVKKTEGEAGKTQFRDVWGGVRFIAGARIRSLIDDIDLLIRFWKANRLLSFTFYDFERSQYTAENIGTGDDVETTFQVPAVEISDYTVYNNGAPQTETTHYSVSSRTGPVGEDEIVFVTPPVMGNAITIDFEGRRKYDCEFIDTPARTSATSSLATFEFNVRESF